MKQKISSKISNSAIQEVTSYIAGLTGVEGHFSFLEKSSREIAVFRRLSFVLCDETTMIRLRLLSEVDPQIKNSVLNGLYIGDVRVNQQGRITKGLDHNRILLLRYLLQEPAGAYAVKKEGRNCFCILNPGNFAETLIGLAAAARKCTPKITVSNMQWHVRMPGLNITIGRFREFCRVEAEENIFLDIIGAKDNDRRCFTQLSLPCVLRAFGRVVDVSGLMRFKSYTASQLSDRVFIKLFDEYEKAKNDFVAGKPLDISRQYPLPEISGLPETKIYEPDYRPAYIPELPDAELSVKIPRGKNHKLYKEILSQQYLYLRDCCMPEEIRKTFRGKEYCGIVSAVDPAIYPPVWSPDHFLNAMAMADFNLETAGKMLVGGLLYFMKTGGRDSGSLTLKKDDKIRGTTYPVWMVAASYIYNKRKDNDLLKTIFPFLSMHNNYVNRTFMRKGICTGAGGFWNDYSTGPKKYPYVAGIGMNSLIAFEKKILAEFAGETGAGGLKYRQEYNDLAAEINARFWDEELGFYFDYNADTEAIFRTRSGGYFRGLDNLLPLFAGIVPEDRARRMEKYLLSSDYYGKYPAITTDLSADFMDERRLMIWVMTNWLVIQGLNSYGMHETAKSISTNIFNALLKYWTESRCLPEALSATHELCPMENPNIAGVGGWAGFCLYLNEIYSKKRI
jgi:hypothetical protein